VDTYALHAISSCMQMLFACFEPPPCVYLAYALLVFGAEAGGCLAGIWVTLPPVTGTEVFGVDGPLEAGICWQ